MDLARLVVKLEAQTASYAAELEKAKRQLGSFEKSASAAVGKIAKAAGAAAIVVATGFAVMAKAAIDTADNLNDLSKQTGISVESLSRLQYATKLSGADMEGLVKGMRRLAVSAADAAQGIKAPADAFQMLGVSASNADGTLKGSEELLLQIADVFSQYEDGAAKAAIAQDLFGKSGVELIPFLNQGRAGIEALTKEAERLGLTVSGSTAAAADEFNDSLERLKGAAAGVVNISVTQLVPVLNKISEAVEEALDSDQVQRFAEQVSFGFKLVVDVGYSVYKTFDNIGGALGALAAAAVAVAQGDFRRAYDIIKMANADQIESEKRSNEFLAKLWSDKSKIVLDYVKLTDDIVKKSFAFGGGESAVQEVTVSAKKIDSGAMDDFNEQLLQQTQTQLDAQVQAYHADQAALDDLLANKLISVEQYNERIGESFDKLFDVDITAKRIDVVKEKISELNEFQKEAFRNTQDIIADTLVNGFDGGIKGVLKSFGDMIIQLTAQAVAADLAGKLFGSAGGGTGGGWVNAAMSLFGMGSGRAMGGPVAAGTAYKINENTPNSEWFVPSQNGKVVPANQIGGGGVTNHFHISAPNGSVSMETQTQIANRMAAALAAGRRRNG